MLNTHPIVPLFSTLTNEYKSISSAQAITKMPPLLNCYHSLFPSQIRSIQWRKTHCVFEWLISGRSHLCFSYLGCVSECLSRACASWRLTARTVDGFESTCVMKYIWSIKAYSFSVPFNWWARGWAGQCPQALSALAAQGAQHTHTHTFCASKDMQWQAILHKPFVTLSYPLLISSLCALDCREGNHLIHSWILQHLVRH